VGAGGGIDGMRWLVVCLAGSALFLGVWLTFQNVVGLDPGASQAIGGAALAIASLPFGVWATRSRKRARLLATAVATASLRTGEMHAFVVTTQGGLLNATYAPSGQWSKWGDMRPLGRVTDVTAAVTATDRVEVFYVDTSGELWTCTLGERWTQVPKDPAAGRIVAISANSPELGHREVYAVSGHGNLTHRWRHDTAAWGAGAGWIKARDVALSVPRAGTMECWAVGLDGQVRNRWYPHGDGGWSDWDDVFGRLPEGSAVAADVVNAWDGHQELFVVRADGGVVHRDHWQGRNYRAWGDLAAPVPMRDVAAGVTSIGHIEVIAVSAEGDLWQKSYSDDTRWGEWRTIELGT
jgi:hypothetical protein